MIINQKLKITSEQFWQILMDSVAHDIKKCTGKEITKVNSGMSYEKKYAKKYSERIFIERVETYKKYAAKIDRGRYSVHMSYDIEPRENGINVHFEHNLNPKRYIMLFQRLAAKIQMRNMLKEIETEALRRMKKED